MEPTPKQNHTYRPSRVVGNDTAGHELLKQFVLNRNIDEPYYSILIAMYSFLIIFGSTGNILVVLAVLRNKSMQTARNIFIVNLAISDLLLCLVTMPLTLIQVLSKFWPLGNSALLCKSIGALQGTSIFVSTISITAIALDRYHVIVGCPANNLQMLGAVIILSIIWLVALLCALPLYIYTSFVQYELNHTNLPYIHYCVEDWPEVPFLTGRVYYSIFSLTIQYFIPILVVSSAYLRIYFRLKKRIIVAQNISSVDDRIQQRRGRRTKRTNCLLISIALIFGISWLPLNFYNLYMDLYASMNDMKMTQTIYIIYAACHMVGMSSACSNPLLYGWLNSNFKKEFNEILCCRKSGDSSSASHKLKGVESSIVVKKKTYMHEQNGSKIKSELLKQNNNDDVQEFTLTTNI
ncbi:neuropeptide F receptor [Chironomus tepperi]|uniref:neuropeptide F receptor n=1 Tax=Chironomus tepperi TaxID=113505 RepID=UPI00391FAD0A